MLPVRFSFGVYTPKAVAPTRIRKGINHNRVPSPCTANGAIRRETNRNENGLARRRDCAVGAPLWRNGRYPRIVHSGAGALSRTRAWRRGTAAAQRTPAGEQALGPLARALVGTSRHLSGGTCETAGGASHG